VVLNATQHAAREISTTENNKLLQTQSNLNKKFFGFDPAHSSSDNLKKIKNLIAQGKNAITSRVENDRDARFFSSFEFESGLSHEEKVIYDTLCQSFTLKHATDAIENIKKENRMLSVKALETSGREAARHTPTQSGGDESIFFTLGIGSHKTPKFISQAKHTVTVDLAKMEKADPLTTQRLWVSGHLTEYVAQRKYNLKMGGVLYTIKHHKDHRKEYTFHYPQGSVLRWNVTYKDEFFSGYDVAPGIALQFIYLLRLLGGKQNKLVDQLYRSVGKSHFARLLEGVFSHVLKGAVYPEAKIIHHLDIDRNYIQINKNNHKQDAIHRQKFFAVKQIVEQGNIPGLKLLLKKGYPCSLKDYNLLSVAKSYIKDDITRRQILEVLIAQGVNPFQKVLGDRAVIHEYAKEGTASDFEFLLTQHYKDHEFPLIEQVVDLNGDYSSDDLDLVDSVCRHDKSGEKLKILQRMGADLHTYGAFYLRHAIYDSWQTDSTNLAAIKILVEAGVSPDHEDLHNKTPLMTAVDQGMFYLVRVLVGRLKANINAQHNFSCFSYLAGRHFNNDPSNGMTALHFAAKGGHVEIAEYLISQGADMTLRTQEGLLASQMVSKQNNSDQLLQLFNKHAVNSSHAEEKTISFKQQPRVKKSFQKVVTMVVGTQADGERYVLLGKRRGNSDEQRKYYCFPGGSASAKDNSLQEAALRELFEETTIAVSEMPHAKVTQLAHCTGFDSSEHVSTTFFLVDVGHFNLDVHACDDLVEAILVPLNQIMVDASQPAARWMHYAGVPILGSNALLINHFAFLNPSFELKLLEQQLHIEAQGIRMLCTAIQAKDLTETDRLLKSEAHLSPYAANQNPLAIEMLKAGLAETGLALLAKYQVNLSGQKYFIYAGEEKYGTAMNYAILQGDLDIVMRLAQLEKYFLQNDIKGYHYLLEAVKAHSYPILSFLVEQGISPNITYDRSEHYHLYPLMGAAIKVFNLSLLERMLNDSRFYLNRERSPKDRDDCLMTAISHNGLAAYTLLATGRMDLHYNKSGNNDQIQTALEEAEKYQRHTIAEIIQFHRHYFDMNEFLLKHHLPEMDAYQYVLDENDKPSIHFISQNEEKLNQIKQAIHSTAEIKQQGEFKYIRLGEKRLAALCKSQVVADYLLEHTKNSIFWTVRSDNFRLLHKKVVENRLKHLGTDWFANAVDFDQLPNKSFYIQILRENVSINQLCFKLEKNVQQILPFLCEAFKGHDRVKQIELVNGDAKLTPEEWVSLIDCVDSMPELQSMTCRNLPSAILRGLLSLTNQKTNVRFQFVIQGDYSQADIQTISALIKGKNYLAQIDLPAQFDADSQHLFQIIHKNRFQHLMQNDEEFRDLANDLIENPKTEINSFSEHRFDSAQYKHKKVKADLLDTLQLESQTPRAIWIRPGYFTEHVSALASYIAKNNNIELFKMSSMPADHLLVALKVILRSSLRLKHVSLAYCEMSTEAADCLAAIIAKHPLESLDLSGCHVEHCQTVANLAKTIANHPSLLFLNSGFLKFSSPVVQSQFYERVITSKSIVSWDSGLFSENAAAIMPICKLNADNLLKQTTQNQGYSFWRNKEEKTECVEAATSYCYQSCL
jgi:8-oxo-dGTP pyrophosphatase MutT (NUDIX family)